MGRDLVEMTPLIIPILLFLTPIVAILTAHQRKMAEIVHTRAQPNPEIDQMRSDLQQLKHLMHEQAIALDNLARQVSSVAGASSDELRQRTGGSV